MAVSRALIHRFAERERPSPARDQTARGLSPNPRSWVTRSTNDLREKACRKRGILPDGMLPRLVALQPSEIRSQSAAKNFPQPSLPAPAPVVVRVSRNAFAVGDGQFQPVRFRLNATL